jgi:hypothetical protein
MFSFFIEKTLLIILLTKENNFFMLAKKHYLSKKCSDPAIPIACSAQTLSEKYNLSEKIYLPR